MAGSTWGGPLPWHRTYNDQPSQPRYRVLSPSARGLLADLRCLAGREGRAGLVPGPVVGKSHGARFGSIAERLGYRATEFKSALAALVREGWVRVVPGGVGGSSGDRRGGDGGSSGDPALASAALVVCEFERQAFPSDHSTLRTRKFKAQRRLSEEWGDDESTESGAGNVPGNVPGNVLEPPGNVPDRDGDPDQDRDPPLPPASGGSIPATGPGEGRRTRAPTRRERKAAEEERTRRLGARDRGPWCGRCGVSAQLHADGGKGRCLVNGTDCAGFQSDPPDEWAEEAAP